MKTATDYSRDYRARKRAIFQQFKNERGCAECGEKHPATLDLHHRAGTEKHTRLVPNSRKNSRNRSGWDCLSIRDIESELSKCDVLCSNCHRILTARERAAANQGE